DIKVPDIGDFDAVEVIEVLVAAGESVSAEQALITLESDKATLEVPSPVAGDITAVTVAEGDKVAEGDVIARVAVTAADPAPAAQPQDSAAQPAPQAQADSEVQAPRRETAAPQRGAPVRPSKAPPGSQL